MTPPLKPHQSAWLSAHPNRTEAWLRERLRDGFHVHHLDHNPGNNDPANLVLIDGEDHMHVHNLAGGTQKRGMVAMAREGRNNPNRVTAKQRRQAAEDRKEGRGAYRWLSGGVSDVAHLRAVTPAGCSADYVTLAERFAASEGLPWPPE